MPVAQQAYQQQINHFMLPYNYPAYLISKLVYCPVKTAKIYTLLKKFFFRFLLKRIFFCRLLKKVFFHQFLVLCPHPLKGCFDINTLGCF